MENIDQLLEVKTRLTTIKGYAQLLEREIDRTQPRSDKLDAQVEELNREIARLVNLVGTIEASMTDGAGSPPPAAL
jgi:nitrogen-specific signal transduction histidine kinase